MRCKRCHEELVITAQGHCRHCGVHKDRRVLSMNSSRRKNKVGGKRGRNSGKVSQHGKKT